MSKLNLPQLKAELIDSVLMKRVGLQCIFIVRRRVSSGKYLEGTTSEQYSTKPFGMPLGAATKALGSAIKRAIEKGQAVNLKRKGKTFATVSPDEAKIYTSPKTGNLWVIIGGGYKRYRELGGRDSSKIDLNWSGRMMRNLGIIPGSEQPSAVDVGFTSTDEQNKALWHNVMGAGKSRRKHVFMGLTNEEKEELEKYADAEVANRLAKVLAKYTEVA